MAAPSPEDPTKMVAKKVYYLACAFCRWTSRDIGLPDQTVASGGWPEQVQSHVVFYFHFKMCIMSNPGVLESWSQPWFMVTFIVILQDNSASERISALQEHYRAIAQREKIEKESRRFLGRKLSYLQLSDKYGLTTVVARKRAGLPPLSLGPGREELGRPVEISPAEPTDLDLEQDLPIELLTEPLDLCSVTQLPQRLAQLEVQPTTISTIFPRHKHLMIKRSQRCRRCEHNLSKPEYNPTSIKFKIQLAAYYHVPDIVIYRIGELVPGKVAQLVIKVTNPTNTGTTLEFLTLSKLRELKDADKEQEKEDKPVSAINPLRQPSIVTAVDQSVGLATAQIALPASKVGTIMV